MKKNFLMNRAMAMAAAMIILLPMTVFSAQIPVGYSLKDTSFTSSDGQSVKMMVDGVLESTTAANLSVTLVDTVLTQTTQQVRKLVNGKYVYVDQIVDVKTTTQIATPDPDDTDWFTAFCVDPYQTAKIGSNIYLGVDLVSPSAVHGGLQAAWLFEKYYEKDPMTVAALQVAIWEVIVDNPTDKGYSLTDGNFYLTYLNGKTQTISTTKTVTEVVNGKTVTKKITETAPNPTWSLADSMLADLQQNFSANDLDYMYRITKTSTNQDFIIRLNDAPVGDPAGTPEPATLILMGIGVLGLAGFRRFRNNR